MQDVPGETLGDVLRGKGEPRRPKIACAQCEATGCDIRLYVYAIDERSTRLRVVCTGCGSYNDFPAKWVRPQGVSAGVHASLAKAPESKSAGFPFEGIPETLTPPQATAGPGGRRRGGAGRPRQYEPGAEPWVKEGIPRSMWYRRRKAKG